MQGSAAIAEGTCATWKVRIIEINTRSNLYKSQCPMFFTLKSYFTRYTGNVCVSETIMEINAGDPVADFMISDNGTLTVDFTDNSTSTNDYSWDFGDGSTSTMMDPSHSYSSNNSYDIKLIVF